MVSPSSRSSIVVVCVAVVVGLGTIGLVRWLFFGLDEAVPFDKPATVVGTELRLTYTGQECRDRVQVEVDETARTVVVTIRETTRSVVCHGDRTSYDVVADLDAPLGDRELLDGACRLGGQSGNALCADDLTTAVEAPATTPGG